MARSGVRGANGKALARTCARRAPCGRLLECCLDSVQEWFSHPFWIEKAGQCATDPEFPGL
eukprot:scaffold4229_cov30-Tisochrysis_lutea.AAC.5